VARILVVDDDFSIARVLTELFERWGHETFMCSDGLDAIATLEVRRPDAVVTDWQMGEVSGVDVLEVARTRVPDCRRILITASPTADEVREAVRSGVAEYLIEKPWSLVDFKVALRGLPAD
jgi:DNA-binding NtrC family response regulator